MKLSTRARYGVRLMLALAKNYGQGSVFLREVAKSEEISEKYLSQIIIPLRGAGLVSSSRGVHGGYTLSKSPAEITLQQIVEPLEGNCLVDCVKNPRPVQGTDLCKPRCLGIVGREDLRNPQCHYTGATGTNEPGKD